MATSVPIEAPRPGLAEEFERLAQRHLTNAEQAIAQRITSSVTMGGAIPSTQGAISPVGEKQASNTRPNAIWTEGLRPESLAYLAVAASAAEGKSILFITPTLRAVEHRQLRLGTRGPCLELSQVASDVGARHHTFWAIPSGLEPAHLARAFGSAGPDLVIIEDAHAASGTSFSYRPSLANLGALLAHWPQAMVIASSAVRGPSTAKAAGKVLKIDAWSSAANYRTHLVSEPVLSVQSNLVLRVMSEDAAPLSTIVEPLPRPALILCSTPAQADSAYAELENAQVPVHRFHQGLSTTERAQELMHFALPGRRAVMVAVSSFGPNTGYAGSEADSTQSAGSNVRAAQAIPAAFGQGYTREDLRSIVHLCAPCSLEQYAQELAMLAPSTNVSLDAVSSPSSLTPDKAIDTNSVEGASEAIDVLSTLPVEENVAVMLFNPAHLALNLALLERKRPSEELLKPIVDVFLKAAKQNWIDEKEIADATGISPRSLSTVLLFLADAGAIEVNGTQARALQDRMDLKRTTKKLAQAFTHMREADTERLKLVEDYANADGCRAHELARLLGQTQSAPKAAPTADCGHCDHCAPAPSLEAATTSQPARGYNQQQAVETKSASPRRRAPVREGQRRSPRPTSLPKAGSF